MIQLFGFVSGIINGLFAAGAGQVLVFFLAFILKKDAHISRGVSIAAMTVGTIVTIIIYGTFVQMELGIMIIVFIISLIGGIIGAMFMEKIPGVYLNLISGILVFVLSIYQLVRMLILKG